MSLLAQEKIPTMSECTIEISIKGKWCLVPTLSINGKTIIVHGKWIKKAEVNAEEWLETELDNPELCVAKLKAQSTGGLRADVFTFAQKLPVTVPKFAYAMELESVAALRTVSFDEWWQSLPQETRKNVRRSQKRGVVVTVRQLDDDLIRDLAELNNDSPVRQGKTYTHYGKSLDQIRKDQESFPDRRELICAYVGKELIGFLKLVYRGDVASILQLLPKASHYDKRPANALLAQAVEICQAKRISYLTYGKLNYGNKRDSLREFKLRNGFEDMPIPRFYVPLTTKGALWVKCKLYRGILGILPPNVIALGLKARTKWQNLKLSMSR